MGNEGAFCFADLIYNTFCVVGIDLSSNHMTDEGVKTIFTALRTNRSVTYLNIGSKTSVGRNSIGTESIKEISEVLKENKVISELNFSMTELNSINIKGLCPGLLANRTLTHLNLSNNNLKSKGTIAILKSLDHSSLIELRIASNSITDDSAPYFAQFLGTNEFIRILDLSGNELGYRFMSALGGPLSLTCSLHELILNKNPLGGRGISAFGPFLAHNHTLQMLSVNGCLIDCNGFVEFCSDLERNNGLQILHIQHNPLTDEGVIRLANVIKNHQSLREIDLEMVEMTDPGARPLFENLSTSNIETLSIRNNLVSDGIYIEKMIQHNEKLMSLDIEYNDIDYKMNHVIMDIIKMNQKRWRRNEIQRIKYELNHMTAADIELQETRDEILNQRDIIAKLKDELKELTEYFKTSDEKRRNYINELETRNNTLGSQVAALMDECRSKKNELNQKNMMLETEISQINSVLTREQEVYKASIKAQKISEGKITIMQSDIENSERNLQDIYDASKIKYLDIKNEFIAAWNLAREQRMAQEAEKKLEEAENEKALTETSTRTTGKSKSKSSNATTSRTGRKGKSSKKGSKKSSNVGSSKRTARKQNDEYDPKIALPGDPGPSPFETQPTSVMPDDK
ncbi:hypothetical protein TRFO_40391 [Tritrichomonas foetus]|uniref:Leucine Rich Repeat family protein n=1 Tax=Tritrichomonas foetus TaxID=1144522 RepID=A0A1J4J3L9_9EUKA|nr:hypothetical protein TRFO_40391 [Tritrichomonas foetus]|eukprot:OHS93337.1 hypothetical protein TRFO_40391 [Tritrichomonas foetus]